MRDHIYIWNSMARRRRSASDLFEENGVQILKSYIHENGYSCKVLDWASQHGYNSLSPVWLRYLNHFFVLANILKKIRGKQGKGWGRIAERSQWFLGEIQEKRLKRKLRNLAREIARKQIKVLGIKVWYGEAFTMSKYLTSQVKKYSPNTLVVIGGYHASLYEEDILKNSNFDLAVAGNGEHTLLTILKRLHLHKDFDKEDFLNQLAFAQADDPIAGLIYRKNDSVFMNTNQPTNTISGTIPLYPKNEGKIKVHILLESLGCPWNKCNFCVHNKFSKGYQTRNVEDIIFEMKEMIKQGIALFRFAGSETPPSYGKLIAKAILDNHLKVEYTIGCRAVKNCKDEKIFNQTVDGFFWMIQSGLRGIFMGGETGNDTINNVIMNKGIVAEDIRYTIKAFREAEKKTGVKCTVSLAMIFPTPLTKNISHEEVEKDNLELIKQTSPDAVMVSPPGPFKHTTWYCNADEFGFELKGNFVNQIMEYEYVLYKPLDLWPEVPFTLKGMDFKELLAKTQGFKNKIEKGLSIPTDLSDEHFLMIRCSGAATKERIMSFKKRSQLSIITSNYGYLSKIENRMNRYSENLAKSNQLN